VFQAKGLCQIRGSTGSACLYAGCTRIWRELSLSRRQLQVWFCSFAPARAPVESGRRCQMAKRRIPRYQRDEVKPKKDKGRVPVDSTQLATAIFCINALSCCLTQLPRVPESSSAA
jgi:hypothetical protein